MLTFFFICCTVLVQIVQLGGNIMFLLDPKNKMAIFEQIKTQILEYIATGVLSPGDKLPSVRQLATSLGVNPNTVAKTYQELELQGYVYTIPGKGCFISEENVEKIKSKKKEDLIKMIKDVKKYNLTKEEILEIVDNIYEGGSEIC